MSDSVAPEYLAPKEAATYLSVTLKMLEHWRRRGVGPSFHRIGRHIRYARRTLDAFMAEREVRNTSEGVLGL